MSAADLVSFESRLISPGSPFELHTEEVSGYGRRVFRHAPQTLADLYRKAASRGDAPLLIRNDCVLNCNALFSQALRLANGLRERFEVGERVRVGIALENSVEAVSAVIATTLLGATAVLIGEQPEDRRNYCVELACCDLLMAPRPQDGSIRVHTIAGAQSEVSGAELSELLQGVPLERSSLPSLDPDHEALIAFTSGTTGRPKGVVLSHRNIITGLMNMMLAGSLAGAGATPATPRGATPARPCCLLLSPLSHVSGYTQLLLQMMLGGCLVLGDPADMVRVAAVVERLRVRSIIGLTPQMMRALLGQAGTYSLSALSSFFVNGYAVHENLIASVKQALPNVTVTTSYGMTETNGAICSLSGANLENNPEAVGRVVPSVELEFRDEHGVRRAVGGSGEIWVRGAMLMQRYLGAETGLDAEGWFKTGDMGHLTSDGYLVIQDRQKDIIVIRGETVSCLDVERLANAQTGVEEAAVVVPQGDDCRSISVAYVTGDTSFDVSTFEAALSNGLGVPVTAFGLAEIPRNPSGKIDQDRLRKHQEH